MPHAVSTLMLRLKPKRRWMQFGIRSMLVLTTVCGIWLGWRVNEVRREQDALALVESLGGYANFDYQCDFDKDKPQIVLDPSQQPPRGSWIRNVIGEEYFRHIVSIQFRGTDLTDNDLERITGLSGLLMLDLADSKVTDAGLASLAQMRQLRGLDLYKTEVTNAGLVHLDGMRRLHWLNLTNTRISSEGLIHLQGLTGLHTVRLANTQVTDAGLAYLQELTRMRGLDLKNMKVTDAGIAGLRKALPNCNITGP